MRTAARRNGTIVGLLLALALPGIGSAGELVAAGAVSLRGPLSEIARRYGERHPGRRIQLTFGASSFLAAQIRAGAPIDVFVSADSRIVDELVKEGLVAPGDRIDVATNRLVVMARPGLAPAPRSADELGAPEIRRVAMPNGAVPVGRYAREWLQGRGLLEALTPRIVPTEHARATLAAVDAGHADVAVVYATDARLARRAKLAFEVPAAEQPRIVYAAARVADRDSGAAELLVWLTKPAAHAILRRAGFGAP